ncbi:Protein MAK16 homolog [Linum perenne]
MMSSVEKSELRSSDILPTPKSVYEKTREDRIKANLERMQKLGLKDLSLNLSSVSRTRNPNLTKRSYIKHSVKLERLPSPPPLRRSSRLQKVEPASYDEGSVSKKDVIEEEGLKYSKREVYTEEYKMRLGGTERSWTLFVDGYGKDGRRIYDPINGKTCHQCRQKTLGHRTHCSQCQMVQGQFCGDCLYMRYGEHVLEALENPNWTCPVCRGICNCSLCRQSKGLAPTGMLYRKISSLGYKSVAHYLIETNAAKASEPPPVTQASAETSLPSSNMEEPGSDDALKAEEHKLGSDTPAKNHEKKKLSPCSSSNDEAAESHYPEFVSATPPRITAGNFCRNPYNVTGLCNRSSCPLANSRYATIRDHDGVFFLYMKTIERAHKPNQLWERLKLPRNYEKAIELINKHLEYWPPLLRHKIKQRLTKMTQMRIRMRKLALKTREKVITLPRKEIKREARREEKAEKAAALDRVVEKELLARLDVGTYDGIYNYPTQKYLEILNAKELEVEDEEEEEEEMETEYVEGYEELEDIEDFAKISVDPPEDHDDEFEAEEKKGKTRSVSRRGKVETKKPKKPRVMVEVEHEDPSDRQKRIV